MSNPGGKPRVFFFCHPADFERFFESVAEDILKKQNCAIWYDPENGPLTEERRMDLSQMQLFVVPVTAKLLKEPNAAMDEIFPYAAEHHIPVLPLMQESGLEQLFNLKFGDLQFLDKNARDETAIGFDDKLEKYLASVLVGDELAEKVRAAFDAYIFLSYRKKDRKYANELMKLIHKNDFCRDIAIWYDEYLIPGENFNDAIAAALEKCDIFTLAVTPNLINEVNYVMTTEYPAVRETKKPILPAEVVPTDRERMKEKYEGLPECVDVRNEEELSRALLDNLRRIARQENDRDPQHNFFIGLAYLSGIDVEVDHDRALSLLAGAAEAGLPEATGKLVEMYATGNGVERDYRAAISWQERLAGQLEEIYKRTRTEEDGLAYGRALIELGGLWGKLGALAESRKALERAIKFAEKLLKEIPTDEVRRLLSAGCSQLGAHWMTAGDFLEAWEAYERAMDIETGILERLTKNDDPQSFLTCKYAVDSIVNMASAVENCRKYDLAQECYLNALEMLEEIAEEGEECRASLANCYLNVGNVCQMQEKTEEAEKYYRKALELSISLAEETGSAGDGVCVSDAYIRVGDVCVTLGKPAEAQGCYEEAIRINEELLEEDAAPVTYRSDLERCYRGMGNVCLAQDKKAEAVKFFGRALEITAKLSEETGIPKYRARLSQGYRELGHIIRGGGNLEGAKNAYLHAMRIDNEMAQGKGTLSLEYSDYLAEDYDNLGDICRAEEELDKAEKFYGLSLQFREVLAKTNGLKERRALAESYGRIGLFCGERGEMAQAREFYQKALRLSKKLAKETGEPGHRKLYADMGCLCASGLKGRKRNSLLRECLSIYEELAGRFPENEDYIRGRDAAKEALCK